MAAQVAAVLAVVGLALVVLSRWLRARSGVPEGDVIYRDSGSDAPVLRSERYGLAGKPDYLLRTRDGIVPVEVKPLRRGGRAYRSDFLQLAAYCLLTEETQERFGGYGILRAGSTSRRVPFTPELRLELLDTMEEMKRCMTSSDLGPNHANPGRCRSCASRRDCGAPVDGSLNRSPLR